MKCIATFDVGTTAVKGVLVDEKGRILYTKSVEIATQFLGNYKEQNPEDWYGALKQISGRFAQLKESAELMGIIMSGQMQDVILLDKALKPLGNAILYSDGRAEDEACALTGAVGKARLQEITGNQCDGSLPVPKLMWLKSHRPELFARVHKVLIGSKDYLIARLTGALVGDYTACSTAGGMDIHKKRWSSEILSAAGLREEIFPRLYPSHHIVGFLLPEAAKECSLPEGTPVYAGAGDAGATTLASGIGESGQYNINLGTSGWVATVSDEVLLLSGGVFNLAAMPQQSYINVVPFLNGGNVHSWICRMLAPDSAGEADYSAIGKLLKESSPGSNGVFFLPYLAGERFPVLDPDVKGCFAGLTPATSRKDLARTCLEGVAFSVRQGLEYMGRPPEHISVIGGGAQEPSWCQILADVLHHEIYVYKEAQELPALALASAVLLGQGVIRDYSQFTVSLQDPKRSAFYTPREDVSALYDAIYHQYLRLYPAIKGFYHNEQIS